MTRHLLFGLIVMLVALTALDANEPRYNGQPMSFWLDGLKDTDVRVRAGAAYALAEIGAPAKSAVPALKEALRDPESRVRSAAIQALGSIGAPGVPALREALRDPDVSLQSKAIETLGNLGPAAKNAAVELVELLNHETPSFDPDRFILAAQALARMGPDAQAAMPRLRRVLLLDDQELLGRFRDRIGFADQLRKTAAVTLSQIHDPDGSGRVIARIADSPFVSWKGRPASDARKVEVHLLLLKTVEKILNQPNQDEQAIVAALRSLSRSLPRAPRNPELAKGLDRIEKTIESIRTTAKQNVKPPQLEEKPTQPEKKPPQTEEKPAQPEKKPAQTDNKPPQIDSKPSQTNDGISSAADEALAAIDAYNSPLLAVIWELCGPTDGQTRAIQRLAAIDGKRTKSDAINILLQALGEVTDVPTVERIANAIGATKKN